MSKTIQSFNGRRELRHSSTRDAKVYALFRISERYGANNECWVEVSDRKATVCRAFGFDKQEDMHRTMRESGRELTKEERENLIKLLQSSL